MVWARTLAFVCLLPAASFMLVNGCAKKASTIGREAQREGSQLASAGDVTRRVQTIKAKGNALEGDAAGPPGGGPGGREGDAGHQELREPGCTGVSQGEIRGHEEIP